MPGLLLPSVDSMSPPPPPPLLLLVVVQEGFNPPTCGKLVSGFPPG
jgi:hypothetical protein